MYSSEEAKESVSSVSAADKAGAASAIQDAAKAGPSSFLLKMNFKVGAEKMASAIAESVSPRHSNAAEVNQLKQILSDGISKKGAAVKGTTLKFDCTEAGIKVEIDGQPEGTVAGPGISKAFCDVYLDDKAVSPTLKGSCVDNCCSD